MTVGLGLPLAVQEKVVFTETNTRLSELESLTSSVTVLFSGAVTISGSAA